jgi:hypothetical protein
MCTLIIMKHLFPGYPFVVASNRDEDPERDSRAPYLWPSEHIYAPQDLIRNGTWIGVSEQRVFAAITNRDESPHGSGRASRGQLVVDALREVNARIAVRRIRDALSARSYNGFHLVVADPLEAFLLIGFAHDVSVQPLDDGLHVITGYGTTTSHVERAAEIERRVAELPLGTVPTPEVLNTLLRFHANGQPTAAACVHDPNESHRTVSSMIIRPNRTWSRIETWYRNGPACGRPFDKKPVSILS